MPLHGTQQRDWKIIRYHDRIEVECRTSPFRYKFFLDDGTITLSRDGQASHLGAQVCATQYLLKNRFAIPKMFAPQHPGNGLTPIELGVAVPDLSILRNLLNQVYNGDKSLIEEYFFNARCRNIDLYNLEIFDAAYNEIIQKNNAQV